MYVGRAALSPWSAKSAAAGYRIKSHGSARHPHHGSRRNSGPTVLDRLLGPRQPSFYHRRYAVVSAAKNGEPKHPSRRVTNAFTRRGSSVVPTQGSAFWYHEDAPVRAGYSAAERLPLYSTVEAVAED